MKIRISPLQLQRPFLAPSMQQSIEILLLPIAELQSTIEQELQENPLLDSIEETKEWEKHAYQRILDINFDKNLNKTGDFNPDDEEKEEKPITQHISLEQYLLRQLHLEITDPLKIKIGESIIGNLDEAGYLLETCAAIALELQTEERVVEEVLNAIQYFDPISVASRNLKECLSLQAQYKFNGKSDLMIQIINNHLEEISRKKYKEISKKTNLPVEKIKDVAHAITTLEPNPARNFRAINPNIYIKPDIYIRKKDNKEYAIETNRDNLPNLCINTKYKQMLHNPSLKEEEKEFINKKIKDAVQFIKSVEQRHQTLESIARYILDHQKEFLEEGHSALKPMRLKDIAQVIDRNESTVSRAIHNKYIDTPQGIFPMKFFFSQGVNNNGENVVASRSIKEEMRVLFDSEDKTKPFSDQEIQDLFRERGVSVARRTVSKYRQTLRILPSHLRKN